MIYFNIIIYLPFFQSAFIGIVIYVDCHLTGENIEEGKKQQELHLCPAGHVSDYWMTD